MTNQYEKPRIETLSADQIIELMGPVSCGSGGGGIDTGDDSMTPMGRATSGYQTPG